MVSTDHLSKRVDELESETDTAAPDVFRSWGREAGASGKEIEAEWRQITADAGSTNPMAVAWDRSLAGDLFGTAGGTGE